MNILKMFGLVTADESQRRVDNAVARLEASLVSKDETIDRVCGERDRMTDRFAAAVKDLAAQSDTIEAVREQLRQPETPRKSRLWEIVGQSKATPNA